MTLCASGEMSLGGSTVGRSVNCELERSGTTAICMGEAVVRSLAAKASGAISMSNFYNRTKPPGAVGSSFGGGYYTGAVTSPSNYYLVVAPNATGCAQCVWKTTITISPNTTSCDNGYSNTYDGLANAEHPAGNFTATRSLNGFSDWYLPARNELNILYTNKGSMPAGQGYDSGGFPVYWSSTEISSAFGCRGISIFMSDGFCTTSPKVNSIRLRAIRRVAF